MKINSFNYPKSSFLAMEKDMSIIVDLLFKNERLKKLLYHTTKNCLDMPNLTEEETSEMFGKQIKIVPKLYVDGSVLNYIIVSFDNFTQSGNPEFRDSVVEFDIICHFDQWHLKDFSLRPYKIAAELDTMLNQRQLTGLGKLEFLGASQIILTDEYAGLCLMYSCVHGVEDEKNAINPKENEDLINNFNNIFNV